MKNTILIIDDDLDYTRTIAAHLTEAGYAVQAKPDSAQALTLLNTLTPDAILLDVRLGEESGIKFIPTLKQQFPQVPVIMISTSGNTPDVVGAMKAGATDYVLKPINFVELLTKLGEQMARNRTRATERAITDETGTPGLVGVSQKTRQLVHDISKVANSDAAVFLRGESGTGKSLIAELIHHHSLRREHPFVTINCAAIPVNLLESELFGHEKGAFTGAVKEKAGKFEVADRGTIFLDEIGDLNPELQVKILRVLQSHEFERVGGLRTIKVDVRIIAATNRNIEDAVQRRTFREDLFYRLNVLPIYVPPLRERRDDIPLLAKHYLQLYALKAGKHFDDLTSEILDLLINYDWPGNIRELQNVIERAIILGNEPRLLPGDFAISARAPLTAARRTPPTGLSKNAIESVGDIEFRALMNSIESAGGNMTRAATSLGIGRDTLYRRMKKYGIRPKRG